MLLELLFMHWPIVLIIAAVAFFVGLRVTNVPTAVAALIATCVLGPVGSVLYGVLLLGVDPVAPGSMDGLIYVFFIAPPLVVLTLVTFFIGVITKKIVTAS